MVSFLYDFKAAKGALFATGEDLPIYDFPAFSGCMPLYSHL
jgi:hypothetical protein